MAQIPIYPDEAAFPRPAQKKLGLNEEREVLLPAQWGLTKRELFAAMAMQGMLANPDTTYVAGYDDRKAIECADALLKALSTAE